MNLSSTIKSIQDIMRKDDGVDGDAQRIGQLTWMLFLKIFDQCEETWEDDAADRGETYASPMPDNCRWRNWAKYQVDAEGKKQPRIAASDLISHVNNKVFPGLQGLNIEDNPIAKVVHDVFEDTNNYMKTGTLMLGVIEKLDEAIDFHDIKSRGQLGMVYEQMLNDLRSAGNAGEFYTPRPLTELMVDRVNPQLRKREVVLDPACGTGGFETATIAHFEKQVSKKSGAKDRKAIAECIRGFERKQLPHLLCVTNMLLHGIEVPSMIERRNTLARPWNDWQKTERVQCVITNPPFGGLEDEGVGADYPSDLRTRETADMFLTLIVKKLLTDGGRGAVVLPDGTLFGEGVKSKVKKLLLEECNLHTIVRLPNGVFSPYTGIKTNLLFFTKGKPTETIWYYEHRYPEGQKSYSKTRPLRIEEFDALKEWWGNESDGFKDRVETEQAWAHPFKQLKDDAEAKAKPHWDNAEQLKNEADALNGEQVEMRAALKRESKAAEKKKLQKELDATQARYDSLIQKAKDEQATGDRHFWPVFNLDIKNPNAPEAASHDPDTLLKKYDNLMREMEATENQLQAELATAIAQAEVAQ
ncbi:MAG TPA: N-6 DNA methylase [Planctomycetaceae bacterium]|nr:N-6 DNA methylase [Planctomycetaceae bacterium]HQZ64819.1 N-6 DNA methylase [Planctomycetaceae bacterium]